MKRPGFLRMHTTVLLTLVVAVPTTLWVSEVPAAAAPAACSSRSTPATDGQAASRRPVVFVHGWTSNGNALRQAGQALYDQTSHQIQPFYFDYRDQSTTWAANDAVAGCLARYITEVSTAYAKASGDGKVILVGHSMGGLAILYAAAAGAARDDIGGIISFDTPYLGSPFGDSTLAGILQGLKQDGGVEAPPPGADAQVCLGEHANGSGLHAGCEYPLPPFLPAGVPVTQIAGDIIIRRMFGPFHLYDINLDSDGIVTQPSSQGYLDMQTQSAWPKHASVRSTTDSCTINSDTLATAAQAADWTKSALAGLAAATAQIYADNNALDGLLSGHLTPGLVYYLAASLFAAPCSHIHIYDDQSARNQATEALRLYLALLQPPTKILDVSPVDSRGRPAAGWSVLDRTGPDYSSGLDCSFNIASPAARSGDIYYCSPSAATADVCWVAYDAVHVFCLVDPWHHQLVEMTPDSPPTGPAQHTDPTYPLALDLDNGDGCRLRNGGSWGTPAAAPNLVGWYTCDKVEAVWGTSGSGIDMSTKTWTVLTGNETGPLTRHKVIAAYYVSTAP